MKGEKRAENGRTRKEKMGALKKKKGARWTSPKNAHKKKPGAIKKIEKTVLQKYDGLRSIKAAIRKKWARSKKNRPT